VAYWAKKNHSEYSVLWVPALSDATFEQACTEIAKRLGIRRADDEDIKDTVRQHLSSDKAGPWLLVVDNSDDKTLVLGGSDKLGITDYLPQSEHGLILFTTRSAEVAEAVAESDVVELGDMDHQEAQALLEKSLRRKSILSDIEVTTELLGELAYLPLAVTQAAAYLNRNQISIPEYLCLLRGTEQDLIDVMSTEFHDNNRYKGTGNAIATTWLVSFDQIRTSDAAAANLLMFMSHIEPKAIPRSILPSTASEHEVVHAIGTLCSYAFLSRRRESAVYDMHSLVHMATRIWMRKHGLVEEAARIAIRHVARVFPTDDHGNHNQWQEYMPHALKLVQRNRENDMEERYDLYFWMGRCLQVDGRIREAVECFKKCCSWRENTLDATHPDRLASQHALAVAYEENGQVPEAAALLKKVVAIYETTLDETHPSRLASQHALAVAYEANGQVPEGVAMLKKVVAIRETTLDETHPDRLASQHALAVAYEANGQVSEAVALLRKVVAIRGTTLDETHPDRLASQHALAIAYEANGQVPEAVALLKKVVAIRGTTLDETHPDRLASQHALAIAYRANGQVSEAVALLRKVVAIHETILDETHPSRLAAQHALAIAYRANGQVSEAVALLRKVVAIEETTLDETHPSRLASQHALAIAYRANGQVPEGVALLKKVVAIYETTLDETHPSRLASQHALAVAYRANGQVSDAVALLKKVVAIRETILDETHPSRLASQHALAIAYEANGQVPEAVALLKKVVTIRGTTLDETHPDRLASQHALAIAYRANGQVPEAVALLKKVVALRETILDETHPDRLESEGWLAYMMNNLEDEDKGEDEDASLEVSGGSEAAEESGRPG